MPRRDYDEDDDDFDDRPRPRTRRRYDDDDDDYDPRPRRRPGSSGSNVAVIVIAVAIGGVVLLGVAGVGAYFALRAKPLAGPVAVNNPAPPPVVVPPPPVIAAPVPPVVPGMPGLPGPAGPGVGNQVTISNLRVQGVGLRGQLVFDYQFLNGRPIGFFTAVVKEPNGQTATADLHFVNQQGSITLSSIGPFRGNFQSGTQVYIGNRAMGPRNVPQPISNTLTLP